LFEHFNYVYNKIKWVWVLSLNLESWVEQLIFGEFWVRVTHDSTQNSNLDIKFMMFKSSQVFKSLSHDSNKKDYSTNNKRQFFILFLKSQRREPWNIVKYIATKIPKIAPPKTSVPLCL